MFSLEKELLGGLLPHIHAVVLMGFFLPHKDAAASSVNGFWIFKLPQL